MTGTDAMTRAMNLCDRQITVEIGERQFTLKQLPRVPLQKILDLLYAVAPEPEKKSGKKGDPEPTYTEIMFREWERMLPILTRMLGFTPEKDLAEFDNVCVYLDENLAPMAAARLFETWYELNEIDDFFARAGKVLLEPRLAAKLKEERLSALDQEIEEVVNTLKTEAK